MKKILAFALAVLMIVPLVSCKKKKDTDKEKETPDDNKEVTESPTKENPGVDLLDGDLSNYIEIDEKYYKGYTVEVTLNEVKPIDIENTIIQALRECKDKTPLEDGDGIISIGDVVNIFYKGYYLDGETKVYFSGGSNVGSTSYSLEIGSGSFIPGFEYNMIGKNPAEYSTDNPMIIETYFPKNYGDQSLAGKTAYFEVTVEIKDGKYNMTEYKAPEFNEEFVAETLGFTEEQLADYEGETLTDKYRSYIAEYLLWSGIDTNALARSAFWKSVLAGAVIKEYPEKALEEAYDDIVAQIEDYYNNSSYSLYYTFEDFACLYVGIEYGSDWKAEAKEIAKESVKQQLIFYHIMNVEGLKPNAEKYAALFDEYLTEALKGENIVPERYNTTEEYLNEKEQYKAKMINKYGENYFKEIIYYSIGMEAIIGYANIVGKPA